MSGSYIYEGPERQPFESEEPRHLRFDTTPSGLGGEAQIAAGHAIVPNVALAIEAAVSLGGATHDEGLANVQMTFAQTYRVAVLADYFFSEGDSWHMLAGGGVARVAPGGAYDAIYMSTNIVKLNPLWGPAAILGGGYVWSGGFGVDGRLNLVQGTERRENDVARFRAATLLILASYTAF